MRPYKTVLEDHSEAKVKLYKTYLSMYLNILARSHVKKIYLYDVFCGEGVYADGGKGSPIAAIEAINEHYYSNNNSCPDMHIVFNDSEKSEIEPEKYKSDRVKEQTQGMIVPATVTPWFEHFDYKVLITKIISKSKTLSENERALVFIDPQGYKEIQPGDLKELMACKKVEVLLFLPINFMYRFANKASVDPAFKGGRAIRQLLTELYPNVKAPYFDNEQHFISALHSQFKQYLSMDFVDVFKIERRDNLWFALYFFTHNRKGFWKMLEAKWQLDKRGGRVFKQSEQEGVMFTEYDHTGYRSTVLEFLKSTPTATNDDLLVLGLRHNFLPTHTLQVLKDINKSIPLEIISLDKKAALSYYLGNEDRLVNIRLADGAIHY